MYIEQTDTNENGIHATHEETENIYRGLFLVLNAEKDSNRQKQIRKQISAIEKFNTKIEY
ncbi:MAG: hypothetical protein PF489_12800 [Salinivirgaceae bacterium]|jgi:hypothetical protein|nr:hypothetical protein [Salinivirgaceae bacterium]